MPKQVVRCCLENASSVAKTFLTSDAVVVEIKDPVSTRTRKPMPTSGNRHVSFLHHLILTKEVFHYHVSWMSSSFLDHLGVGPVSI